MSFSNICDILFSSSRVRFIWLIRNSLKTLSLSLRKLAYRDKQMMLQTSSWFCLTRSSSNKQWALNSANLSLYQSGSKFLEHKMTMWSTFPWYWPINLTIYLTSSSISLSKSAELPWVLSSPKSWFFSLPFLTPLVAQVCSVWQTTVSTTPGRMRRKDQPLICSRQGIVLIGLLLRYIGFLMVAVVSSVNSPLTSPTTDPRIRLAMCFYSCRFSTSLVKNYSSTIFFRDSFRKMSSKFRVCRGYFFISDSFRWDYRLYTIGELLLALLVLAQKSIFILSLNDVDSDDFDI